MAELKDKFKKEDNKYSHKREKPLVISIDQDGKILHLNKECERLFGYSRKEVLNKKLSDFLITKHNLQKLDDLIKLAMKDELIDNFQIPFQTNQDKEILISWNSFSINKNTLNINEICLIGNVIKQNDSIIEPKFFKAEEKPEIKSGSLNATKKTENRLSKNNITFKFGNQRLIFVKDTNIEPEKYESEDKSKIKMIKQKNVEKKIDRKKDASYKNLMKNYNDIKKLVKLLEQKNKFLERENEKLEFKIENIKDNLNNYKDRKKTDSSSKLNILKGKKKREEFDNMMKELDERKILLDNLESQLSQEKETVQKSKEVFHQWREKLEFLEEEIEKRRNELIDHENSFKKNLMTSIDKEDNFDYTIPLENISEKTEIEKTLNKEHYDFLDKIDECAVIVQRGILKQINNSFSDLIGFDLNEMIEKSFFDYIAPEGFSEVEDYYFNRLKGEDISSCETIILTKDNEKIPVEINVKSTYYQGERAEIFIIKNIQEKKQEF